ncbi:MAG: hypothetical protein QM610_05125 [Chitinophagaceae bacterium]
MNQPTIFTLKALRSIYAKAFRVPVLTRPVCEQKPDKVSQMIYDRLVDDRPCMVARFGAFELNATVNFLGVKNGEHDSGKYIQGKSLDWWWNKKLLEHMESNAGFFPPTEEKITQFCELLLEDMKEVDILGSWLAEEKYFNAEGNRWESVNLELLNPFFTSNPWTKALKDKTVLVVHPFNKLIEYQYQTNREHIFENKEVLPKFSLMTIQAVQSIGGYGGRFGSWFQALDWMKDEIDQRDYDIALVGCGAYGFPLAAHVKRQGKKAVHLGGALQLLFGIRGKRWEDANYNDQYNYAQFMNEYWVKPGDDLKPHNACAVEGGCYW